MVNALDYFSALVREDESIPLFEAALAIAQDADPLLDLAGPQTEIDILGSKLARRIPADASPIQKLRILNHFFYRELGFSGNVNDYYNPDNSYLHRVIATRRGIPISLAVIYMELAQHIGLDVKGVAFPGHFLMKLSVQSGDVILDPFNGSSLSREELEERLEPYFSRRAAEGDLSLANCLQDAPLRDILVRMLRNLKALFSEPPDWPRMLEVQLRLVILLPDDISERRDRGLAYANVDCPQAALQDLHAYLKAHPDSPDAQEIRQRLPALQAASRRAG
jgi:regulator of sirC expression with transglutaminase-like and TPR domain